MRKMKSCLVGSIYIDLVENTLCNRKLFIEVKENIGSMVNVGCKPNAITCDIMIHVSYMIGRIQGTYQLFDRLREIGINHYHVTYNNLLNGLFPTRELMKHIHS